jgi:hypothetical protein
MMEDSKKDYGSVFSRKGSWDRTLLKVPKNAKKSAFCEPQFVSC